MNTDRENNHGEYWPSPFTITLNVKKVWAWLVSFFLMSGICYGQTWTTDKGASCGSDVSTSYTNKQTLSNLLIRSEELDVLAGYTISAGLTITANNTVSPDGNTTAERLTADATNSVKRIASTSGTNRPLSAGPGTLYRTSGYIKAGTHSFVNLGDGGDDLGRAITVNLSNCTIGLNANNISSRAYFVGDGWCYVETIGTRTDVCGGCKNIVWDFYLVPTATSPANTVWTTTGTETVFVWGMQMNVATTAPADYLATTTAGATLGPLCPRGTSQSFFDPSRCFPVRDNRFRVW